MSLLSAAGIVLSYGRRRVLDGLDFAARPGELVGLIGPNGAGKTSLIRTLAGLASPQAGHVAVDGLPLAAIKPTERARDIGYLAQSRECAWGLSVERLVALGRLPHGARGRPADDVAVGMALEACGLTDLAHRRVDHLSGGERARAMLARVLAGEPRVLLADEPVAGLDPRHQFHVMDVLAARAAGGLATVVVLHDLDLAARFCHRLVLMCEGRIMADGPPAAVLKPDLLETAYGMAMMVTEIAGRPVVLPYSRHREAP